MDQQPNPKQADEGEGGAKDAPRKPGDMQAVKNQATVTPDDYPDSDGGKPDYKHRDRA